MPSSSLWLKRYQRIMRNHFTRIAVKLVLWLLVMGSGVTLLTTFGQLYFDYKADMGRVSASIEKVAGHQLANFSRSVQANDGLTVDYLLKSLIRREGIAYAAVLVNQQVAWQQGSNTHKETVCTTFPLAIAPGDDVNTAALQVLADTRPVHSHLVERFTQMLVANGIKIFMIAAFVLLMFQYLVTRHLQSLAAQVGHLDLSKPNVPLTLDRPNQKHIDELDQVVNGLNAMQKRARDAYEILARNEQRLLLFFDSTEDAILGVDSHGLCTFANDACLHLLGAPDYESLIGRLQHDLFVHTPMRGEQYSAEDDIIFASMSQERALSSEDGSITVVGGRTIFVTLRVYPVFKDGSVSGAIVFISDNTATRQLRHERALLSEAIEQVPMLVIIADKDNVIHYVNPGTEKLTGFGREELLGSCMFDSTFCRQIQRSQCEAIEVALRAGCKWEGIIETQSKYDTRLKFFAVFSPIFDNSGRMMNSIAVCREVSYEMALQSELVNAKKMEALGRLSASFAHEFGNPLFGVRSVLRDIADRVPLPADDKRLVELAYEECEKMRYMVREFQQRYRDTSTGDMDASVTIHLRKVLKDVSPLMATSNVACTLDLARQCDAVATKNGSLMVVFRNIIVNAIESMGGIGGGNLHISGKIEGNFCVVTISDGGLGIKREYQEMIFEPFFSTKPEIEGRGLGLSVAYGTMKSLGGTITFASEEGRGAEFNIHIPLH